MTTNSLYYTDEHEAFRDTIRRFVSERMEPFADEWDEAEEFPRELYKEAGDIGLLGMGYPEELGGTPADPQSQEDESRGPYSGHRLLCPSEPPGGSATNRCGFCGRTQPGGRSAPVRPRFRSSMGERGRGIGR